jgi:hypothetical protein
LVSDGAVYEDANHIEPIRSIAKGGRPERIRHSYSPVMKPKINRDRISHLNLQNPGAPAASGAAAFSQCIASADPRLKAK